MQVLFRSNIRIVMIATVIVTVMGALIMAFSAPKLSIKNGDTSQNMPSRLVVSIEGKIMTIDTTKRDNFTITAGRQNVVVIVSNSTQYLGVKDFTHLHAGQYIRVQGFVKDEVTFEANFIEVL
jgi:hypothetical protein